MMTLLNAIGIAAAIALIAGGIGWLARPPRRESDPYIEEFDNYKSEDDGA